MITITHADKLSEVIFGLFTANASITDVRVSVDEPVRVRFSSNSWVVVCDEKGQPIIATRDRVYGLINLVYHRCEEFNVPLVDFGGNVVQQGDNIKYVRQTWQEEVKKRALNPSLSIEGRLNDTKVEIRVRLSIKRVGMGVGLSVMVRGLPVAPERVESLGLPPHVTLMTTAQSGIVMLCGSTGAGKSTTIAACLSEINHTRSAHIVTIEDPIEFLHDPDKSFFTAREVGVDVASFAEGVIDALRDVPDVILIGEIRSRETMIAALRAGESGHLVFASMHAPNAVSAVSKMLAFLGNAGDAVALASNLIGVVAQNLVTGSDNQKHLAFEMLDCRTPAVRKAIGDGSAGQLEDLAARLRKGELGNTSTSMASCLQALVRDGKLSPEQAAGALREPDEVREMLNINVGNRRAAPPVVPRRS